MRFIIRVLTVVLFFPTLAPGATDGVATLTWKNGDELSGQLLDATSQTIRWKSPVFAESFSLDIDHVSSIDYGQMEDVSRDSAGPMRFLTESGDILFGELVGASEESIVFQSQRHGQVEIAHAALRSVWPVHNTKLMNIPTNTLVGWQALNRARNISEWSVNNQGHLTTSRIGAELFRDLRLPLISEIALSLRWKNKPGFVITVATPEAIKRTRETVKLETWDDELVLQTLAANGDFEMLRTLTPNQKHIELRLLWNQKLGQLAVYTEHGELLGKIASSPADTNGRPGLYIQNKGSDLTLAHLRVGNWSGMAPGKRPENSDRLLLNKGETVYGRVTGYDRQNRAILFSDSGQNQRMIPLDQFAGIYYGDAKAIVRNDQPYRLAYYDGSLVRGQLVSVDNGKLTMRTAYCARPLECDLTGARQLKSNTAMPEGLSPHDVLEYEGARLHGTLAAAGDQLGWQLAGGTDAIALDRGHTARIIRSLEDERGESGLDGTMDIAFMRNGDLVPCRLEAIDEKHLIVDNLFGDAKEIPRSHVKAIEFHKSVGFGVNGFGDQGWITKEHEKDVIKRDDRAVAFHGPGILGHPELLHGNELEFDLTWNANQRAYAQIALFSPNGLRPATPTITLYSTGPQVVLQVQGQNAARNVMQAHAIRRLNNGTNVKITIENDRLELFIDKRSVVKQQLIKKRLKGNGVVFTIHRMGRRQGLVRRLGAALVPGKSERLITISNLKAGNSNAMFGQLRIDDDVKREVLTVPRYRKTNPPTHVLVARNGDLLRGKLASLTDSTARFTSRLDNFSVPRDRLAGIVWLDAPPDESSAEKSAAEDDSSTDDSSDNHTAEKNTAQSYAAENNTERSNTAENNLASSPEQSSPRKGNAQVILRSGVTLTLDVKRFSDGKLVGTHAVLGECRIPVGSLREVYLGRTKQTSQLFAYQDWSLTAALEPKFATVPGAGDPRQGGNQPFGVASPLVGQVAPEIKSTLLDGQSFRLSDHAGKVIVLDFWATWCGPCIEQLPAVIEALGPFPDNKVVFVAVNLGENQATIRQFLENRGLSMTVGTDLNGRIANAYQVEAIPQTVVINPSGRIERLHVGLHPTVSEELTSIVKDLIDGESTDQPSNKVQN